jgi:hypothetical protein
VSLASKSEQKRFLADNFVNQKGIFEKFRRNDHLSKFMPGVHNKFPNPKLLPQNIV